MQSKVNKSILFLIMYICVEYFVVTLFIKLSCFLKINCVVYASVNNLQSLDADCKVFEDKNRILQLEVWFAIGILK